jgi:Zn-dependent protease
MAFLTIAGSAIAALVVGIAFHEFNHAFAATRLGDPTPRYQGRLSLNPLAHLDPAGSIMLLVIGFGWGKPVQFNPRYLKDPVAGSALIGFAGPLSNFVVASLAAVPLKLGVIDVVLPNVPVEVVEQFGGGDYLGLFLTSVVIFNTLLGVFNLIPIPPLDGFKVLLGVLPRNLAMELAPFERYGPPVLMLLILLPFLTGGHVSILSDIMFPVISRIIDLLIGEPL